MVKNLRIGLIGKGVWGRNYLISAKDIKGIELVDITNEVKTSFKENNTHYLLRHFYDKNKISGFILATLPNIQPKILNEILLIKAPVICEKPLCLNYADLISIKNKVQPNQIIFLNHFHLFLDTFSFLEKNIHADDISQICIHDGNWGPFRDCTPSLLDWGVHAVGIVLKLMNKSPVKIDFNEKELSDIKGTKAYVYSLKFHFPGSRPFLVIFGNGFSKKKRVMKIFLKNQIKPIVFIGDSISGSIKNRCVDLSTFQKKQTPLENLLTNFRECIRKNETDPKKSFKLGTMALETLLRIKQKLDSKESIMETKYIGIELND